MPRCFMLIGTLLAALYRIWGLQMAALLAMGSHRSVLAIVVCHFCNAFGGFMMLSCVIDLGLRLTGCHALDAPLCCRFSSWFPFLFFLCVTGFSGLKSMHACPIHLFRAPHHPSRALWDVGALALGQLPPLAWHRGRGILRRPACRPPHPRRGAYPHRQKDHVRLRLCRRRSGNGDALPRHGLA